MSTLEFVRASIPGVHFNGESTLPAWNKATVPGCFTSELEEDDHLYLNYGSVNCCHPYREQNQYDHDLHPQEMLWAVLENENLRAVFAPEAGGKLWSLLDKKTGKDLLFANPVNKPCNLAIRNAWTSGGVEWNCGFLGHHPHTCDTLFTARLTDENGEPVLRMYEYERVRNMTYQMDFSLPAGSPVLYCRMRIVNPNAQVTPIYWWSNMAVPEIPGARVVIPAHQTYTNFKGTVIKVNIPVPDYSGIKTEVPETALPVDVTYPMNSPVSVDYFWKLDEGVRRFTCQLDAQGYGLVQASTNRLKGRKLFVWGQGPGGNRWQQYLSGNGCDGHYVEIQAGLASSQYESLPMPPYSAWEWMEVYGPMQADSARVHGEWDGAIAEVNDRLEELISDEALEQKLKETRKLALTPASELLLCGSGWGALENVRRRHAGLEPVSPHLDFGPLTAEQQPWAALLETGSLPEAETAEPPVSWVGRPEWEELLGAAAKTAPDWQVFLQLAGIRLTDGDTAAARSLFERSNREKVNAWAIYGLACCSQLEHDPEKAVEYALLAHYARPENADLSLFALQLLYESAQWETLLRVEAGLTPAARVLPRVRMYTVFACIHTGDLARAEQLLYAEGGLEVPDIREGEVSLTELWYQLEEAKAKRDGTLFDRATATPPHQFDFRMFAAKKPE